MFLYVNSSSSLDIFPTNKPWKFICQLARPICSQNTYIGLKEIEIVCARQLIADLPDAGVYLMIEECSPSFLDYTSAPIIRKMSLLEFRKYTPVVRFDNTLYVRLRGKNTSTLTISLCPSDSSWTLTDEHLTGSTKCTFHITDCPQNQ